MTDVIRCEVDGNDYSEYLVGIQDLTPGGPGEIGTATLVFKRELSDFFVMRDKHLIEVGLYDGTDWVWRDFAGWVTGIDIDNTVPVEFLAVAVQDHNVQLDALISQPGVDLIFAGAVDFDDMVLAVVTAYNGAAAVQIDASSQVANLVNTAIMPTVTVPGNSTLREALQRVMDAAQLTDDTLRPRFFLGMDTTTSPLFGPATLYVYDAAVPPSVTYHFSDEPTVGQYNIFGTFKRSWDGTRLTNRQYMVYEGDATVVGEDTTSQAAFPNPYSPDNAWMSKAAEDRDLDNSTDAQAAIDRFIAETAYPRETVTFDTPERVAPGMVVGVTWDKEHLIDEEYRVVSVSVDYSDPLEPMRQLTLNARFLELGEDGDAGRTTQNSGGTGGGGGGTTGDAWVQGGNAFGEAGILGTTDNHDWVLVANNVPVLKADTSQGTIGIGRAIAAGSVPGNVVLSVRDTFTGGAGYGEAVRYTNTAGTTIGMLVDAVSTKVGGTIGVYGIQAGATTDPAATATVSDMHALDLYTGHDGSGTVTERVGLYVGEDFGAGPITNAYGIRLEPTTRGTTANWAIYNEGGDSFHAGDFEFGTNAQGPILTDRTTGTKYRLYVNSGVLLIEVA